MKIIIVGAGEVGFHVSRRLAVENKEVIVIDKDAGALNRISDSIDVQTVHGSGSSPQVLEEAGIGESDILLAVTDSDEINLISCFFANMLAPDITKLARIRGTDYTNFFDQDAGAALNIDKIINPDQEVVNSILRLMSLPGAEEISEFADGKIRVIGMSLPPDSPLIGVKLMNLRQLTGDLGLVVAALVREDSLIIPGGEDVVQNGDVVYFAYDIRDQDEVLEIIGLRHEPVRKVLIVGGGNIGHKLAKSLDNKFYHTRLLDSDAERCEALSANLDKVIVLQGDGTDQEILAQENIGDLDLVVSLTGDEEMNILTCLLAKSMGAKQTIVRINNFAYMPLIKSIGIDHLVCPRLSAINSLLHFIRRGKIMSAASIKGEEAEIMEAIAEENSSVVGKPVKDLNFPKGALILCFQRGTEVVLPRGDVVIEPQDRLIILATRKKVGKVEEILSVKREFF